MKSDSDLDQSQLAQELQAMSTQIEALAEKCQGDVILLLYLLRYLESLHRHISQSMFKQSLPDTRHQLYFLLREIEETGGWPYIERMKIQDLLHNLSEAKSNLEESSASQT